MNKDCFICGIGGQGIVLASRVIAQAAINRGEGVRTSETIGMAQRGGCVSSHVRIGDMLSPQIPQGHADLFIAFEPGEAVRNLSYLREGGTAIISSKVIQSAASTGKTEDAGRMLSYLKEKISNLFVINCDEVARLCGSLKVLNIVMLGAGVASGTLGMTLEEMDYVLTEKFAANLIDINKKALRLGAAYIKQL